MKFLFLITVMCIGTKEMILAGAEATISETSGITQSSDILKNMVDVIEDMKQSHNKIRKLAKTMIQEGEIMEKDIEMITRNPLSQLHFMNRYTEQWKEIEKLLNGLKESRKLLNTLQESAKEEKESAVKFLVDLVDIYDLDIRNVTLGIVKNMRSGENLSMLDILDFADEANDNGMYSQCAKWLERAIEKAVEDKLEFLNETLTAEMKKCKQKQENLLKRYHYKKLCRRESTQSDESAQLQCYYRKQTDPRLLFEPAKIEPLSQYSDIILYHELVPRYLGTRLTDLTTEELKKNNFDTRHIGINEKDSEEVVAAKDVVLRITQNIPSIKLEDVEELLITSYKREFRTFFFDTQIYKPIANDYNLLIYLSEVQHGGATVFYHPPVNVVPGKGDVLVWGKWQIMAECPVLYGKKFTGKLKSNLNTKLADYMKWIFEDDDDDLAWPF